MTIPISVVTVTYNNASGLRQTLKSLEALRFKPLEVVIVDGGSTDGTPAVVAEFEARLPLAFESERDAGIYDAMNKGRSRARGALIHYLNAGDSIWGEPYMSPDGPSLLPVRIHNETGGYVFDDFPKWGGYGYCHQGILFPANHDPYDTKLEIAADLDLIIATFPKGLRRLPLVRGGGANFGLGGLSTVAQRRRDQEYQRVLMRRLPKAKALWLLAMLNVKNLVPRFVRRGLANCSFRSASTSRKDQPES